MGVLSKKILKRESCYSGGMLYTCLLKNEWLLLQRAFSPRAQLCRLSHRIIGTKGCSAYGVQDNGEVNSLCCMYIVAPSQKAG